jgi:hypothetical protein
MDPMQRTNLQAAMNRLRHRAYKDDEVISLLAKAEDAFKSRDWKKAEALYEKAKDAFTPPVRVTEVIVRGGGALTGAEARRMIERGQVKVDGVILRKVTATVLPHQRVVAGASLVQKGA